jgi:hypothetical protein
MKHPIETGQYLLLTPVLRKMLNCLESWVDYRNPGGIVYGRPRTGKTTLIDAAEKFLSKTRPRLFGTRVDCNNYTKITERTFFADLLRRAGHAFSERGTAATLRERYIEYVAQRAQDAGDNIALLYVDEAHRLHENHYLWLMDVYNGLHHYRVDLVTILVGQEELRDIREMLLRDNKYQIVARFMNLTYCFEGIANVTECRICLTQYDEEVFPRESNISFTAHYFREAANVEWKIASIAEDLWEAFSFSPIKRPRKRSKFEVPMQAFCRTINYILRVFGPLCDCQPQSDRDKLDEAIEASGFRAMEI